MTFREPDKETLIKNLREENEKLKSELEKYKNPYFFIEDRILSLRLDDVTGKEKYIMRTKWLDGSGLEVHTSQMPPKEYQIGVPCQWILVLKK